MASSSSPPANPKPLITHIHTADPSAHVFNNTLYIYPSHDIPTEAPSNDNGDQYAMKDYHVFSIQHPGGPVTDHGISLDLPSVPWASQQLWAPDAAEKNGKYYLYFPARDHEGIFHIGVAVGETPSGPFLAERTWIKGGFSIDPAVFVDDVCDPENGSGEGEGEGGDAYLYFGGLWGGQLQCWTKDGSDVNSAKSESGWTFSSHISRNGPTEPHGQGVPALTPRVAKLSGDMLTLASPVRELQILDETGSLIAADDHDRRFFEASWLHKYNGTYYFSYSTGDTHYIVYATSLSPWGPFTYRGRILEPVLGWTTHHSIVEWQGKWWLFYHDCEISGGESSLRNVKMREITYDTEGKIHLAQAQ
ncbi:putative xylosidase [Aspergillus californicus]